MSRGKAKALPDRLPLVGGGSVSAEGPLLPLVPKLDEFERALLVRRVGRVLDGARCAAFASELDAMLARYGK